MIKSKNCNMNTIQATELRIGNFIGMNLEEYPNNFFTALEIGETMKVYDGLITLKGANIKRVETSFMYVDDLEPIPLNEDWLVKFGFEKIKLDRHETYSANHEKNFGNPVLWLNKVDYLASNGSMKYFFLNKFRIKCEYVHQLQNIYFALTGTELTLTDK